MEGKRVHIIKRGEGWVIKKQENVRASKWFESKNDAIKNAEVLRKQGYDLIVHNENGGVEKWKKTLLSLGKQLNAI